MRKSFSIAVSLVAVMWLVFILNELLALQFNRYGILPRQTEGLKGIIFAPFLHANFAHLISNTLPMLILCATLFWFYPKSAGRVLLLSIIIGGILVWIFARSASHIGASGVIFSLVAFLIASGIFRKKFKAFILGLVVFFFYGGVIWGVLPTQPGVSWESHLFGFISGIVLAYFFRDYDN